MDDQKMIISYARDTDTVSVECRNVTNAEALGLLERAKHQTLGAVSARPGWNMVAGAAADGEGE